MSIVISLWFHIVYCLAQVYDVKCELSLIARYNIVKKESYSKFCAPGRDQGVLAEVFTVDLFDGMLVSMMMVVTVLLFR